MAQSAYFWRLDVVRPFNLTKITPVNNKTRNAEQGMESIKLLRKHTGLKVWSSAWTCVRNSVRGTIVSPSFGRSGIRCSLAFLLAVGVLAGGSAAKAQNTGSILGSVQDKTGAVVPGASVSVADTSTGVNRTVKSNGSGEYLIPSLPVGTYILTVGAPNFETAVVTDIKVDANSNIKELISLQAGATSDQVTVQDTQGSVIDPNSATIATMLDPKMIEDLPIDGHNVVALSALLPGVVDVNAPSTFTGDTKGPTYSASGSRNTQNLMLFDGLMWNNLFYNTGINYPTPNALQEVSILLNNYKAQYGRNAGSVFNVLTKRGTNVIHGAVWDYLQNQYFNAADYLSHVNPKDDQNQFGLTIGGPIFKDKLFYFGAYQQLIGHLQTTGSALTPGYAERGLMPDGKTALPCNNSPGAPFPGMQCADFSSDVFTGGVYGKFTNPITVTGTSGNQATSQSTTNDYTSAGQASCVPLLNHAATVAGSLNYLNGKIQSTYMPFAQMPIQCINPVTLSFVNKFVPVPNLGGFLVSTSPAPTGDKNGLVRMDYILNGSHSLDARYNVFESNANAPLGVNSSSQGLANFALVSQHAKSNFGNIGWQWVMTPSLLNNLRFGYKRFESTQFPDDSRTWNNFCSSTDTNCTNGNFVETGQPTLPAINISGAFALGSTSQGFQDHINENVELSESLSWTKGNHNVQGGFSFLRLQYLTRQDYPGSLAFSTTFTGLGIGDFMGGLLNSVTAQNRLNQGGIQHNVFGYVQDDWRATSKLTLNLGVRYELPFQWFEPHGQSATFVPGLQSIVFKNAPGGLGFPGDPTVLSSLVPTDYNGVAPRIGFAYDTTGAGKFLIRGGFGIFFDAVNANVVGVGEPYHYNFFAAIPAGGASIPLENQDANSDPTGSVLTIPTGYDPKNPQFIAPYSNFFPDKNFRTPYVMAVNFGFQWHVPHGGVLDTNYVGKFARKLTIPVDLNPAIVDCSGGYFTSSPGTYCSNANSTTTSEKARVRYQDFNYGGQGLVDIKSIGTSSYHALQMQYTQRGGRYLTILSSYTYSRSIDIQTNGQTTSNAVPDVFNVKSDRGPSDNNATHNVTLGWVLRFPRVTTGNSLMRAVVNNWAYSGQYLAHTGRPYSVTINNDTALDDEPNQRAALLPGISPVLASNRHRADKVNEYFNVNAFTYPTVGTFSTVGRNAFVGPGYIMTNMTIGRDFPLAWVREGMRLNFRAEAFNVFNTPNLANPNGSFSCSTTTTYTGLAGQPGTLGANQVAESCPAAGGTYGGVNAVTGFSNFGRVLSTFGNNANTSTNGRKMQFALTVFY
jgi:Carboxypeptidase regulatory-like domain/TonB-dependent Receptor Plug Domain